MSLPQQYASAQAVAYVKWMDANLYEVTQSRYPFWLLDQTAGDLNIYGEMAQGKGEPKFTRFVSGVPPVVTDVCMRVILNPEKSILKKFGLEHPRDAIVEWSIGYNERIGLVPKIGDRFDFTDPTGFNEQYELMTFGRESFYANTKIPLRFVMGADKARRIRTI